MARRGLAFLVAVAAGVGMGATYLAAAGRGDGVVGPSNQELLPAAPRDLMAIFDPSEPLLIDGTEVELGAATTLLGFPVYRLAGETPTETWVDIDVLEAGLRYGTDVVLLHSRWPASTDVSSRYEELVREWRAGYTMTIAGHPAWVVPQDAQDTGFPPVNVVHVSIGDVEVTLFGQIPVDELIRKAETLEA